MIKRILIIGGVGFIISLGIFTGLIDLLVGSMGDVRSTVVTMPIELRVIFFACIIALLWAFYDAVLT